MRNNIYQNTLWLSFRHIANICASLILVRILMLALGENGYALMVLIMGITASVSFLKDAFSGILQRYYAISLGGPRFERDLSTTFIYLIIFTAVSAIFGYLFSETYLIKRLTSSYGLDYDYWFLIKCVLVVLIIQFVSAIPIAISIAEEKMSVLFFVSIIEALLKLLLGIIIWQGSVRVIEYYFVGIVVINVLSLLSLLFSVRHILVNLNWANFKTNKQYLLGFASYINWSLLGEGASKLKDQLVIYVLEWFFTPGIVVARALSYQVAWSISGLPFSFTSSLTPSLTKEYSKGETEEMKIKVIRSIDFLLNLILIISFAIIAVLPDFLVIWLAEVPEKTIGMTFLIMAEIFFLLLSLPFMAIINASGQIKSVNIFQAILFFFASVLIVVFGYMDLDVFTIVLVPVVASLMNLMYRGYMLYKITSINVLIEIRLSRDKKLIILAGIIGLIISYGILNSTWINLLVSSVLYCGLFLRYILKWK